MRDFGIRSVIDIHNHQCASGGKQAMDGHSKARREVAVRYDQIALETHAEHLALLSAEETAQMELATIGASAWDYRLLKI